MNYASSRLMRTLLRAMMVVVLCGVIALCAPARVMAAEATDRRVYDLPAGDAAKQLKLFSQQSGRGVIAGAGAVSGIKTNAVRGEMTPREAVDQMLANTGLVAALDEKTGAFAIRKDPNDGKKKTQAAPDNTLRARDSLKKNKTQTPQNLETMNRNKLLAGLAAVASLFASPAANAQDTGTITGRILNEATGQYLRSAIVTVVGTNITGVTESGGVYTLSGVPAGEARLAGSFLGLDPVETTVSVVRGQTVVRDISMNDKSDGSGIIKMGEFRVVTEREGNYKAIQDQKAALEIKSVIASDAFGDVSEGNVGEFLKMMPGVMMDYVAADARAVSISGLDPKYATIMMDGAPLANGVYAIDTGRAFEFESVSITSIETVELSKTPTPDVSGSALAGVVNLRSKGAFDRKGRQVRYALNGQLNSHYMTLGKGPGPGERAVRMISPNVFLEYSDVFFGEKLGVLAGYNFARTFVDHNSSTVSYAADSDPTNNQSEVLRMTVWQMVDAPKTTDRTNYNMRFDYKVRPGVSTWLRFDRSDYLAIMSQRNVYYQPNNAVNGPRTADPKEAGVEYSMASQTAMDGQIQPFLGGGFAKFGATTTYAGGLEYKRGAFAAHILGNASFSTSGLRSVTHGFTIQGNTGWVYGSFRWNRAGGSDPAFNLTQLSGPDWRDPVNYRVDARTGNFNVANPGTFRSDHGAKEYRYTLKSDFRYNWRGWKMPMVLKWGGDVGEQIRNIKTGGDVRWNYLGPDGIASSGDEWWEINNQNLVTNRAGGNIKNIFVVNRFAMGREFLAHPERFVNPNPAGTLQSILQNTYKIKEQVDSAYAQVIVKATDKLDIAPGFRFERTRSLGRASADRGVSYAKRLLTGDPTANIPTNTLEFIQARYGTITDNRSAYETPLHATYRWNEGTVLRASFNESLTRPNLNNLAGRVAHNPDALPLPTVTLPNRDLIPEQGRNLFASAERYFAKGGGFLTIAGARRDIGNLIRSVSYEQGPGETYRFGELEFEGPYKITTVDNIANAHLSTLEVSYRQNMIFLPGAWQRISVFGNYTRLHYDRYENFYRPKEIASGGFSFDYHGFAFRWNVSWRPMYRTGAINATTGYANMLSERLHHDVQGSYRLSRWATIYFNGRNIFNQKEWPFLGPMRRDIVTRFNDYGVIWNFGVKGTF